MERKHRIIGRTAGIACVGFVWLASCSRGMGAMPGAEWVGGAAMACPETGSAEAIEKFDYQQAFRLEADAAAKLKAGLVMAAEMRALAAKTDADLRMACSDLAKDLGAPHEYPSGEAACAGAIRAIEDFKARLGAHASIVVEYKPPACRASVDAMSDCAARCDARVTPGRAKVECEPGKLSGACDAKCEGQCDFRAPARCEGTCSGTCDARMRGTCVGRCNGKCEGKLAAGGVCNGVCDGVCDAHVEGQCSGQCAGSCHLTAPVHCDGTCAGKCSVEFREPKCSGEVKPPEMSAECKAKCQAQVTASAECTPAAVWVKIDGAADPKAALAYKAAMEKNLPAVLRVAVGVGERGIRLAGQGRAVVSALQTSVHTMVRAEGTAGAATGAKLAGCVAAPFKAALDASTHLEASVNVSVKVKAAANARASGKTS